VRRSDAGYVTARGVTGSRALGGLRRRIGYVGGIRPGRHRVAGRSLGEPNSGPRVHGQCAGGHHGRAWGKGTGGLTGHQSLPPPSNYRHDGPSPSAVAARGCTGQPQPKSHAPSNLPMANNLNTRSCGSTRQDQRSPPAPFGQRERRERRRRQMPAPTRRQGSRRSIQETPRIRQYEGATQGSSEPRS
jgi:hypothetical protein